MELIYHKKYITLIYIIMKSKVRHSKRVIGAPNTNKEKVLGPTEHKEWIIGQQIH